MFNVILSLGFCQIMKHLIYMAKPANIYQFDGCITVFNAQMV
ncbi:hypothetical protein I600_2433 [Maribacter dokdonensis DSW-8]|nr:hypothetical protein I600_2433 [Maribacter dokdonensis DSW-8]